MVKIETRIVLIFLLTVLLAGCASAVLTPEGRGVRKLQAVSSGCRELGDVRASDVVWGSFYEAEIKLKNLVASAGGNAYVIHFIGRHSEINATAFLCQ